MKPGSKWQRTASSTCPWRSRKSTAWVEIPPSPEGSSQDAISCPESGHLSTTMRISSMPNSIDQPITRLARITFGLVSVLGAPTAVNVVDLRASLCSHASIVEGLVGSNKRGLRCRFRSLAEFIPTHAVRLYARRDETIKKHPLRQARQKVLTASTDGTQ